MQLTNKTKKNIIKSMAFTISAILLIAFIFGCYQVGFYFPKVLLLFALYLFIDYISNKSLFEIYNDIK